MPPGRCPLFQLILILSPRLKTCSALTLSPEEVLEKDKSPLVTLTLKLRVQDICTTPVNAVVTVVLYVLDRVPSAVVSAVILARQLPVKVGP